MHSAHVYLTQAPCATNYISRFLCEPGFAPCWPALSLSFLPLLVEMNLWAEVVFNGPDALSCHPTSCVKALKEAESIDLSWPRGLTCSASINSVLLTERAFVPLRRFSNAIIPSGSRHGYKNGDQVCKWSVAFC